MAVVSLKKTASETTKKLDDFSGKSGVSSVDGIAVPDSDALRTRVLADVTSRVARTEEIDDKSTYEQERQQHDGCERDID